MHADLNPREFPESVEMINHQFSPSVMHNEKSSHSPRHRLQLLIAAALTLILPFVGSGCRSLSEPGDASFASVTIENHTAEEIAAVTAQVFGADGYQGGANASGTMVFEKVASRGTSLAREGLVAGYYGAQTINRVRVEIVPLSGGSHRLQCKAFMVTGGSDTFFQDEVPVSHMRSGPYRSLLKKVAKQLK